MKAGVRRNSIPDDGQPQNSGSASNGNNSLPGSRIALVVHALYGGGAERLMSQLANRWAQAGHEVHLVTLSSECTDQFQLHPAIRRIGLDLMQDSRGPVSGIMANATRMHRLRNCLLGIAPDFVLSFTDKMNIITLLALCGSRVPVWIAEHSDPQQQYLGRFWEACRSLAYRNCRGCVALTEGIADYMARWVRKDRLRVIPPAVTTINDSAGSSCALTSTQPPSFAFLGRLSREKGCDLLLEAWSEVASLLPEWKLLIVGEGAEGASLRRMAENLPRVEFAGWQSQPWDIISHESVFVLPSRYEGFPVALLEAMSRGLPCIATRCTPAIDEIQQALYVVPPLDAKALGEALLRMGRDPRLRLETASLAKEAITAYSWEAVGAAWDRLLEQAVAQSG